ncbi:MAG: phytanoyl-CoA dioxygenase family protein [Candidatus Methylomirabilis sp.]|nr:phytanoyl-CoA dioxygenase family protein [Deltaproteobacteria bacterium]
MRDVNVEHERTRRRLPDGVFDGEGVAFLPGFLRGPELDDLRRAISAARRTPRAPSCERPHNVLMPLRWDDSAVGLVVSSVGRMERLRRTVGARDLRWISGYVSTKPARSPALWWHQDWWCWDHSVSLERPAAQVAVLCYVDDTRRENGALRILPGTHRRSIPLHALLPEAHAASADALAPDHPALRDHPAQRSIEAKAGDAVVVDYRLLHGAHANATGVNRDCLLLTFAPSWSTLPKDIQGHLVQHPALPRQDEEPHIGWRSLLPTFDGPRSDLRLNRNAPASFVVT